MAGHKIQFENGDIAFIDYADGEGSAVVNGRLWRWEFNEYSGPLFLRKDGSERKCQFPTVKAVWDAFEAWHIRYERNKRNRKNRVK